MCNIRVRSRSHIKGYQKANGCYEKEIPSLQIQTQSVCMHVRVRAQSPQIRTWSVYAHVCVRA